MISKISTTSPCSIIWKGTFSTDYFNITLAPPDEFVYDIVSNCYILNLESKDPKAFTKEYTLKWLESHKEKTKLTLQTENQTLF